MYAKSILVDDKTSLSCMANTEVPDDKELGISSYGMKIVIYRIIWFLIPFLARH